MVEIGAGSGGHEDEERRPFLPILFGALVFVACLALLWGFVAALRPPASGLSVPAMGKGTAAMLHGLRS